MRDLRGESGISNAVVQFAGIGLEVVKFVGVSDGVIDEFIAIIADHAAGVGTAFGAEILGIGNSTGAVSVGHHVNEIVADEARRSLDAGDGKQRACDVDGAGGEGLASAAIRNEAGSTHKERNVGNIFVETKVFVHEAMAAAEITVVGGVDNEGVAGLTGGFEVCENSANVVIQLGNDAVVEANNRSPLLPDPVINTPETTLAAKGSRFSFKGVGETFPRGDGGGVIAGSEFADRTTRQVRLGGIPADDLWLAGSAVAEESDNVIGLPGERSLIGGLGGIFVAEYAVCFDFGRDSMCFAVCLVVPEGNKFIQTIAWTWLEAFKFLMVFTNPTGAVAGGLEELKNRGKFAPGSAVDLCGGNAKGAVSGRPCAGKERGAGRGADRNSGVGAGEGSTRTRESIQMRRVQVAESMGCDAVVAVLVAMDE